MLMLHLTRADSDEGVYLELPAPSAGIDEILSWLDDISTDVGSTHLVGVFSDVRNIEQYIKNADVNNSNQMKKLNRIAEITDTLDLDECRMLEGALDAESVNDLDDVIAIGEHLNQYLLIPHVTNDRELGICLVTTGVKHFDESTQYYLDYARIGVEYYSDHGGAYTAESYVVRRDSVEQVLRDLFDKQGRQEIGGMQMG